MDNEVRNQERRENQKNSAAPGPSVFIHKQKSINGIESRLDSESEL